jgi:cytochrome oxidase assembly protein ShyY1
MTTPSTRRQILLSRDTLLGLVAVLVLAAVCVALGLWQYGRYEDRRDEAAVVETNYDAMPVALEEVLPEAGAPLAAEDEWTPVTLQGSYCTDPECVLYVRNRQLSGTVGFWQLVPFRAEDGTTLMVVRGWVPSDGDASAPANPAPVPDGELAVTVRLHPAEVVLDREPPPGQTHSVNPPQAAGLMGLDDSGLVARAYGELAAEEPAAERPAALPSPDTSLGPHLSYAFQWWIFALFFPAALIYRTRRLLQDAAADEAAAAERVASPDAAASPDGAAAPEGAGTPAHDEEGSSATGPPRTRRPTDHRPRRAVHTRRRGQDEEEEDALIDQRRP